VNLGLIDVEADDRKPRAMKRSHQRQADVPQSDHTHDGGVRLDFCLKTHVGGDCKRGWRVRPNTAPLSDRKKGSRINTNSHESSRMKTEIQSSFIREDSCLFVQIRDLAFNRIANHPPTASRRS